MSRFFIPSEQIQDDTIRIEGGDAQHIGRVLRLGAGDELLVCDGAGFDYQVRIEQLEKNAVVTKIISRCKAETEPKLQIVLFQGIPKAAKMDFVIQKAVELGVAEVVPVMTKRTVVKLDSKSAKNKVERWNKIAAEASKQCNRAIIPSVAAAVTLTEAVEKMQQFELKLIPYEAEEKEGLKNVLEQNPNVSSVGVLIGPEGGFDQAEVEQAVRAGLSPVRLGRRILRTETAPLAVISALMYAYGELN